MINRSSKTPLHKQVRDNILDIVAQGTAGQRLPAESALAKQFGVSRFTVNKVMDRLQREGFIKRFPSKGSFICDKDKRIETSKSAIGGGTIVIAYTDVFSYVVWKMINISEAIAVRQQMNLANFKITGDTTYESLIEYAETFADLKGLIVMPPTGSFSRKSISTLMKLNVPVVSMIPSEYSSLFENFYAISKDHFQTGYLGVEHLIKKGHKNIGYIANEPWHYGSKLVYSGMKQALYDNGLQLKNLKRSSRKVKNWENSRETARSFTEEMLNSENRPTALIFDSKSGGLSGLRLLHEMNIKVPQDISIIVNDILDEDSESFIPAPTTIGPDLREQILKAFELIQYSSDDVKRKVSIPVLLTERET